MATSFIVQKSNKILFFRETIYLGNKLKNTPKQSKQNNKDQTKK